MHFSSGGAPEPTVIVIDDDVPTARLLKNMLRMMGMDVVATGSDGKDAARLYQKYTPDIVFTDIMMPGNDGFYALKEIRKLDSSAQVIAITGDSTDETAAKLKEANISAVIYKPFEIEDIKKVLFEKYQIKID